MVYKVKKFSSGREYNDFSKEAGCSRSPKAFCTEEEGSFVINLPPRVSTSTRLHELGHVSLGHEVYPDSARLRISQELDADRWVGDKTGRFPTFESIYNYMYTAAEAHNVRSVSELFNLVVGELESRGYVLGKEGRSRVWWDAKSIIKQLKEES